MSRYTDTLFAITSAIKNGDPDCPPENIYNRIIDLRKPTADDLVALFERKMDNGKTILHGYMYDRTTAPHVEQAIAGDGVDTALQTFQRWELYRFYSYIDDPRSGRISTYDFQEAIDRVHDAFQNDSSIVFLGDIHEMHLDSVITIPIDKTMLANRLCHFAKTLVTFRLER